MMKLWCACGRQDCKRGIPQEHLGTNYWRIHDLNMCYEIRDGRKKIIAKTQSETHTKRGIDKHVN
jgi:hypothetical protein